MKELLAGLLMVLGGIIIAGCGEEAAPVRTEPSIIAVPWASPSPAASAAATPGGAEVAPLPDGQHISIDSPDSNTTIRSPITVSGTASVPSGTVVAVVLDGSGNELGRATTTASAAAPAFGHYSVSVDFKGSGSGKGQIKVVGLNPRDGSATWFYWVSVRFSS